MSDSETFEGWCLAAIEACRLLKPPYSPTAWVAMMDRHGAVEAAKRLVVSGDIQSGFLRLVEAGRPDLTIEWAIVEPRWRSLFDAPTREAAQWRLRQAGVLNGRGAEG